MIRPDFRDFKSRNYLAHSAKGSTWGSHKYTSKKDIGGKVRYFYGNESSDSKVTDMLRAVQEEQKNWKTC